MIVNASGSQRVYLCIAVLVADYQGDTWHST